MKNARYFPHDYNARNNQKVLELRADFGLEGYAVFFMALEIMAEDGDNHLDFDLIGGTAVSMGTTKDKLLSILNRAVEINLINRDEKGYYHERMNVQKEAIDILVDKRKNAGKARWHKKQEDSKPDASAKQVLSTCLTKKVNEIKESSTSNTGIPVIDTSSVVDTSFGVCEKNISQTEQRLTPAQKLELNQKKFYREVAAFLPMYPRDMLRDFYDFWTEPNKSGTRMRKELEKTWDLSRRLAYWSRQTKMKSNGTNKRASVTGDDIDNIASAIGQMHGRS